MTSVVPNSTDLGHQFASQINGKTVLITGPSPKSIAAQMAIAVAPHAPKLLILAGRSASKLDATAKDVKEIAPDCLTRNLIVDFASLESVRRASKSVNEYAEDIDVAVLCAGIMGTRQYQKTEDGFESQFGTNHLGHFLFANNIVGKLQAAGRKNPDGARVVLVSSDGHALSGIGKDIDEINFQDGKTYNPWKAYGQSKTANCLFALSLSNKLSLNYNIQAYGLHPGAILTTSLGVGKTEEDFASVFKIRDEMRKNATPEQQEVCTNDFIRETEEGFRAITVDQGAATLMVAAFDPKIKDQTGKYLQDAQIDQNAILEHAKDPEEAERLWGISEEMVGQSFVY